MQTPAAKPSLRLILAAAAVLVLTGCTAGSLGSTTTVLLPVAGGTVPFSYGSHGPILEEKDGVRMEGAGLEANLEKRQVEYYFKFAVKPGAVPLRVTIVDITEDPVQIVCEDRAPRLVNGEWTAPVVPLDAKDPSLGWLFNVEESLRAYRITIPMSDGRTVVLTQVQAYADVIKAALRKALGLES